MPAAGRAASIRTALPAGTVPFLLALPALAASAILPWQTGWLFAVLAIVILGVPHGALDVEIGRTLLRRRVGRAWFPVFAIPYLALVAAVMLAWRMAPELTLAAFLAASVWHFGSEDAGTGGLPALARGGLPVALPVLLHPAATAHVFATASGTMFTLPPAWLTITSLFLLIPIVLWVVREIQNGRPRSLLVPGLVCAAFTVLPPLTAFALYFVAVHAPAHTAALMVHPTRVPRVRTYADAWRLAAPTTLLTVAIGAALFPFYPGALPVRTLCLTLQLLAAFTLPHMMLDAWLERRDQATARVTRRSAVTVRASAVSLMASGAQRR